MARRISLRSRLRKGCQWVTCNKMKVAIYMGIVVNVLFATYGMSGIHGTDVEDGKDEGKGLGPSCTKAFFDDATTPCKISRRTFLNVLVGTKRSSASPILQDDKENSCFEGHKGTITIEMREAMNLNSVQFRFRKGFEQFWPRNLIVYGSENQSEWVMLTRVEIKKHQTDQSFSLKGHTMPPKYLKIIVADNWGGPQTLIERIKVR